MLKVQALTINLQGLTASSVWRAIFFPLFKKGYELLKHPLIVTPSKLTVTIQNDFLKKKHHLESFVDLFYFKVTVLSLQNATWLKTFSNYTNVSVLDCLYECIYITPYSTNCPWRFIHYHNS